jgi:hypothetical protein
LRVRASFSSPVQGLQVGEDQLGVDRLDVRRGINGTVHMHHVRVVEHPNDLADRVGLADVREELVAEALPLGCALDQARDVHKGHRGRHDPGAFEYRRQPAQPRIGQRHHADVWLDGRERIVRGQHVVVGQRVEQGGLADVGQSDDAEGQAHDEPV